MLQQTARVSGKHPSYPSQRGGREEDTTTGCGVGILGGNGSNTVSLREGLALKEGRTCGKGECHQCQLDRANPCVCLLARE